VLQHGAIDRGVTAQPVARVPALRVDRLERGEEVPLVALDQRRAQVGLAPEMVVQARLGDLEGIGDVRAKAIVKNRPYKGKDELVQKKIIPQNVYDDIKEQIIAKQDTAKADAKTAAKK
jgi:hypothetical protein